MAEQPPHKRGPFAQKIDALYRARLEQVPLWHQATVGGGITKVSTEEALEFMVDLIALQRHVTLVVADEIDELLRGTQPDA